LGDRYRSTVPEGRQPVPARNTVVSCLPVLIATIGTSGAFAQPQPARITSPNEVVEFVITSSRAGRSANSSLTYRVGYRGQPVIVDSALGLEIEGQPLSGGWKQVGVKANEGDETYRVPASKSNPIRNRYRSLHIDYVEDAGPGRMLSIEARAYDDGVAFRYLIPEQRDLQVIRVTRERTEFRFAKDATTYPLVLRNYATSYEDEYQRRSLSGLHPEWLIGLPLLAELPGVAWVALAEAHIENYAGMYLGHGANPFALEARLAPRPDNQKVAAIGRTPFQTPWRVVMLGQEPGRLIESNILLNLNPPSAIADTSWIKPGKTSWNWWSGNYAERVSFRPGMNTSTIKHYLDFSAEAGFPYMLIDAGWAAPRARGTPDDITAVNPSIDMPELLHHAKARNVKPWLWAHWTSIDRQIDAAFPLFEKWGIAGVKIDFMDRDDQIMVDWYHRVLKKAAAHHLMIDFHGAYKPDGIERTYPNLMTREGVMGLEYLKWSARVTPVHNCTLPFTRMLAGPMDYTPGGFLNVTREVFVPRSRQPMVMGTRAHQLALFVVFESHLQMVSDYPERYRGEKDFEFIRAVPASWDETRVLSGHPMQFIAIARRSGEDWFLGCLTDWDTRDLELPLDFLRDGQSVAEIYADAPDAAERPTHTKIQKKEVARTTKLMLHLAPGGGAAVRIRPPGREINRLD
jgi:alpha-glucosidase